MSELVVTYEELVKELKSLLDSSQKALDVATLRKDYRSFCCRDLNTKVASLGYPSVEEFLRILASQGEVRIDYQHGYMVLLPGADEKTAHIRKLVQRQAPKRKNNPIVRTKYQVARPKVPPFLKNIILKLVAEHDGGRGLFLSQLPAVLWKSAGVKLDVAVLGFKDLRSVVASVAEETPLFNVKPVCAESGGTSTDFVLTFQHSSSGTLQTRLPDKTHIRNAADNASSVTKTGSAPAAAKTAAPPMLSKNMKDSLLRAIENSGPGGLNLENLPDRYKKIIGRELNIGSLQFKSLEELVSSIPDVALVRSQSSGQLRVKSTRLGAATTASQLPKSGGRPPESTDAAYEPMTRSAADSAACSFAGPLTTCDSAAAATSSAVVQPPIGGGDGPAIVGTRHFYRLAHLPEISLESVRRNTTSVRVVFVESPWLFYVQLASDAARMKLESMEKKLREAYSSAAAGSAGGLAVPAAASLEADLLCAAPLRDGRWCRVEVVARQEADDIQVKAIDYGSLECVKLTSLRLLKPDFVDLPPQAIACCLAGVAPKASCKYSVVDSHWAAEATKEFKRMCENECHADFVGFTHDGCQLVCLRVQQEPNSASGIFMGADVAEALIIGGFANRHKDASWSLPDELALPFTKPNNFCEEILDESVGDLFIRRVALRNNRHLCFVVTFEGHDHVTSSEICSYLKFESTTLLKLRLKQHSSGGFPHILLSIDQGIDLIQCLQRHGLRCHDDGYSGVTLYELQSIDDLLVAAGCDDLLLMRCFRRYLLDCEKARDLDVRIEARLPAAAHSLKSPAPTSTGDPVGATADALQRGVSFKRTASSLQSECVSSVSSSWAASGGPRIVSQNTSGVRMSSASVQQLATQGQHVGIINPPRLTSTTTTASAASASAATTTTTTTLVGRGRGFLMNTMLNGSVGRGRGVLLD